MNDPVAQARVLAAQALGRVPEQLRPLEGGFANLTFLAEAAGRRVVVRLHRRAPEQAPVEAAVLERASAVVSVPRVLLDDAEGRISGAPALVLEFVEGECAEQVTAREPWEANALAAPIAEALARIHSISFPGAGALTGRALVPQPWPAEFARPITEWVGDLFALPHLAEHRPLLEAWQAQLARAPDAGTGRALVHSDFNFKNLIVRREGAGWRLAAVLDWEFAYAGHPLADLGNLLRFEHRLPPGFRDAVAEAYRRTGGVLPERWREIAAALDAGALVQFLRRGPSAHLFEDVLQLVRRAVARR